MMTVTIALPPPMHADYEFFSDERAEAFKEHHQVLALSTYLSLHYQIQQTNVKIVDLVTQDMAERLASYCTHEFSTKTAFLPMVDPNNFAISELRFRCVSIYEYRQPIPLQALHIAKWLTDQEDKPGWVFIACQYPRSQERNMIGQDDYHARTAPNFNHTTNPLFGNRPPSSNATLFATDERSNPNRRILGATYGKWAALLTFWSA